MTLDELNKYIGPESVKERYDFWNNELKPFCIDQGFSVMTKETTHYVCVGDDRRRPALSAFIRFDCCYSISFSIMALNTVTDSDRTLVQFYDISWDKVEIDDEVHSSWTQLIKDSEYGEYWIQQRSKCPAAYFEKYPTSTVKNSVWFRLTEYTGPMMLDGMNFDTEWKRFKKDNFKGVLEVRKKYNFARNLMRKIEIEDATNGYNL